MDYKKNELEPNKDKIEIAKSWSFFLIVVYCQIYTPLYVYEFGKMPCQKPGDKVYLVVII